MNLRCSLPSCTAHERAATSAEMKLMRCSRCQVARYCSVECQSQHWKEHRAECKRLNSDRLKATLQKSEKNQTKSVQDAFASMSAMKEMLLERGVDVSGIDVSGIGVPDEADDPFRKSLQGALDLRKRKEEGTLSEDDKKLYEGMEPYIAIISFTGVFSKKGSFRLPSPKNVEDILDQVKEVVQALREKVKIFQKGTPDRIPDRIAKNVRQFEKKVAELKEMDDISRERLSVDDLLVIRQDLQKRVGAIWTDMQIDLQNEVRDVKQVLLDSNKAFRCALDEARPDLRQQLQACEEFRNKIPPSTRERWTYLHSAAELGFDQVADALLRHGTPVNAAEGLYGTSPLGVATNSSGEKHNPKLVTLLLDAKADVDYGGWTKRIANPACGPATCLPPLTRAAQFGNIKYVELLLEAGAKVDAPTGDGATALFVATEKGHLNVVRLLISKGADANWIRHDSSSVHDRLHRFEGCSVLTCSQLSGHRAITQELLRAGAKAVGEPAWLAMLPGGRAMAPFALRFWP